MPPQGSLVACWALSEAIHIDLFLAAEVAAMAEASTMESTQSGTVMRSSSTSATPRCPLREAPRMRRDRCVFWVVIVGSFLPLPVFGDVQAQLVSELQLDELGARGGDAAALGHLLHVLLL